MSFVHLVEPRRSTGRFPIFALGFRPFFLLAGLFAAFSVPLWLLVFHGLIDPASYLPPTIWHGHEMVFGFAAAVIAGFLLTAAANWTGQTTASGPGLAALATLWLAGRVVMSSGADLAPWIVVVIDTAFLPVLALGLALVLLRAGNRRNLIFPVVLLALGGVNLSIHLSSLGVIAWDPSRGLKVAVDLILVMIGVLGGRVIPSFTKNALPQAKIQLGSKASPLALAALVALALSDIATSDPMITGAIALAAGIINGLRMKGWGSFATAGHPILWILHVGYGWLAVGLVLRGLADLFAIVPPDAGTHALTVGAIGAMTLGMMSRVALGHTGRSIVPARATVAAYWLVNAAALVRVLAPIVLGGALFQSGIVFAGALWSLAFLLFSIVYLPILVRPRADGRPG
ncbi:MAG TPA: NnrS family protein [Dongiaceae bacterium]|nr:NnrS family protein [Dongiaceae bacterium]